MSLALCDSQFLRYPRCAAMAFVDFPHRLLKNLALGAQKEIGSSSLFWINKACEKQRSRMLQARLR